MSLRVRSLMGSSGGKRENWLIGCLAVESGDRKHIISSCSRPNPVTT